MMKNMVADANVGELNGEYKVMVKCPTYNHSRYICDALNGFAIQQTDFPFICVVVDDASTDGAQDVIKQYANDNCDMSQVEQTENELSFFIKVAHKENKNCTFLFCLLKQNLYGTPKKQEIYKPWRQICRYEALCEGDDYWIDKRKLQLQADLMDAIPDCTLCYHACRNLFEEGYEGWANDSGAVVSESYTFDSLLKRYNFQYGTTMCRTSVLNSSFYRDLRSCNFVVGDLPVYMTAAHMGRLCGIPKTLSVYRRTNSGMSLNIYKGKHTYQILKAYLKSLPLFSKEEQKSIIGRRLKNMKFWKQMSISKGLSLYYCILLRKPVLAMELIICFAKYIVVLILRKFKPTFS